MDNKQEKEAFLFPVMRLILATAVATITATPATAGVFTPFALLHDRTKCEQQKENQHNGDENCCDKEHLPTINALYLMELLAIIYAW